MPIRTRDAAEDSTPPPPHSPLCPTRRQVPRLASKLDQLWVSVHASVAALLHAADPAADAVGLPREGAPSDHLPLGVVLTLPAAAAAAAAPGGV